MVNLPKKKVGIISCGGEELPEGTISRVASRMVLESLRPEDTVTLCLPLFLSGDESERAFARVYPTIAVDGCDKLCAKRATEKFSAPVAGSVVVSSLLKHQGATPVAERRRLGPEGTRQAAAVAAEVAGMVDQILGRQPSSAEDLTEAAVNAPAPTGTVAVCSCQSGALPVTQVEIGGESVGLVALEPLFEQAIEDGLKAGPASGPELLASVALYNPVPPGSEAKYAQALAREYAGYLARRGDKA